MTEKIEGLIGSDTLLEISSLTTALEKAYGNFGKFLGVAQQVSNDLKNSTASIKTISTSMNEFSNAMKNAATISGDFNRIIDSLAAMHKKAAEGVRDEKTAIDQLSEASRARVAQERELQDDYKKGAAALLDLVKTQNLQGKSVKELTVLLKTLQQATANVSEEYRGRLNPAIQQLQQALNNAKQAQRSGSQEMQAHSTSIVTMRSELAKLVYAYERMSAEAREKSAPAIKKLNDEIAKQEALIGRHQRNVGNYASALSGLGRAALGAVPVLGQLVTILGAVTLGVTSLYRAVKDGIKINAEYEQANANLATIMRTTRSNTMALQKDSYQLGLTTEWMTSQIVQAQTELAKLGFRQQAIIQMTKPLLGFATALGTDLASAAKTAGSTLRAFRLPAYEAERTLAAMTVAANSSAMDFNFLSQAVAIVGASASVSNVSLEDTLSLLGVLANSGLDASRSATALRNIFLYLADPTKKLGMEMKGVEMTAEGMMNEFIRLRKAGMDLGDMFQLTDKRAVNALAVLVQNAEQIMVLRKEMNNLGGELDRIRRERLDTMKGSVILLKSAWEALMLTWQDSNGVMAGIVRWLTKIIRSLADARLEALKARRDSKMYAETTEAQDADVVRYTNELADALQDFDNRLKDLNARMSAARTKEEKELIREEMEAVIKERDDWQKRIIENDLKNEEDRRKAWEAATEAIPIISTKRIMVELAELDRQRKAIAAEVDRLNELKKQQEEASADAVRRGDRAARRAAEERLKQLDAEIIKQAELANAVETATEAISKDVRRSTSGFGNFAPPTSGNITIEDKQRMAAYDRASHDARQLLMQAERMKEAAKGVFAEALRTSLQIADPYAEGFDTDKPDKDPNKAKRERLLELERQAREKYRLGEIEREMEMNKAIFENEKETFSKRQESMAKYYAAAEILLEERAKIDAATIRQHAIDAGIAESDIARATYHQRMLLEDALKTALLKSQDEYLKKAQDMQDRYYKDSVEKMKKDYEDRIRILDTNASKEREVLSRQLADKEITQRQFKKRETQILTKLEEEKYLASVTFMNEYLEKYIEDAELRKKIEEEVAKFILEQRQRVADARVAEAKAKGAGGGRGRDTSQPIASAINKAIIGRKTVADPVTGDPIQVPKRAGLAKADERARDTGEKLEQFVRSDEVKIAQDIIGRIIDIANMYYDNEIQRIDDMIEANRRMYDEKLEMLQFNNDMGLLSDEYYTAERKKLLDRQKQDEEKLMQKKKEMQVKQARWQKANAIVQAVIGTAQGIANALSLGLIGIPLAAVIGALGTVQIAMIASQKIPEYAKGTDYHKGGLAVVGDAGKSEVVTSPHGDIHFTPSKPTLIKMQKGSKVFPDAKEWLKENTYGNVVFLPDIIQRYDKDGNDEYTFNSAPDEVSRQYLRSMDNNISAMRRNSRYVMELQRQHNFYAEW